MINYSKNRVIIVFGKVGVNMNKKTVSDGLTVYYKNEEENGLITIAIYAVEYGGILSIAVPCNSFDEAAVANDPDVHDEIILFGKRNYVPTIGLPALNFENRICPSDEFHYKYKSSTRGLSLYVDNDVPRVLGDRLTYEFWDEPNEPYFLEELNGDTYRIANVRTYEDLESILGDRMDEFNNEFLISKVNSNSEISISPKPFFSQRTLTRYHRFVHETEVSCKRAMWQESGEDINKYEELLQKKFGKKLTPEEQHILMTEVCEEDKEHNEEKVATGRKF